MTSKHKYSLIDRLNGIEIAINSENALEKLLNHKFRRKGDNVFVLAPRRRKIKKRRKKR